MNGLGDLIYYILKYTGIHWLVHKYGSYTGFECGCKNRRKTLNRKFPFTWLKK